MKLGLDVYARIERAGVATFAGRVAKSHGVRLEDMLTTTVHEPEVVRARRELVIVAKDTLGLGYAEAGRLFGMDHTSVMAQERRYYGPLFLSPNLPTCSDDPRRNCGERGETSRERRTP